MTDRADAKKSQPTRADREAAAKLKLLWDAKWKGLGKTQADFLEAGKLAWSQSTVSQYINGKISLNYNALLAFATVLGFKPEDVRTDLPEQAHIALVVHPVRALPDDAELEGDGEFRIDTLEFEMSAGTGKVVPTVVETRTPVVYRESWFRAIRAKPERVKRVRIDGDSMEPTLYDGDFALIHLDDTRVVDGRVYALIFGSDRWGRVKRLYRTPTGLRIVSDNTDKARFPDEIVEGEQVDEVRIIGRVVDKSGRGGL